MEYAHFFVEKIEARDKKVLAACLVVALTMLYTIWGLITKRDKRAPPSASIGMPFIGNYVEFAKNPVACIAKGRDMYGDAFTMPMLHKNLTFLLGPEASEKFYSGRDDEMSQSEVYGFMTPVFGEGVVYDAPLEKRQKQTSTMGAALLKSKAFPSYISKIEEECKAYFDEHWKANEGKNINLLNVLSELTILTSSKCLHGDDVRQQLGVKVAELYHDLDQGVQPLSFFFPYAPTAAHKKRDEARVAMVNLFSSVIASRREKNLKDEDCTDILQNFINMKYKDGSSLSNDEVVGLLIALLFAGQHTSSITSSWTMYYLLHNKDCMAKAMAEQRKCYGESLIGCPGSFDVQSQFTYLPNCVNEALRLQPPLIMLMRMAMVDVNINFTDSISKQKKEYTIPKGDIVVVSPAVSHKMSNIFPEPEKFIPERFNEKLPNYSFQGFGGGIHQCIGRQFGLLQVQCIVSYLLRNYEMTLCSSDFPEPDYTAMVVGPKNHLNINYKRLSK